MTMRIGIRNMYLFSEPNNVWSEKFSGKAAKIARKDGNCTNSSWVLMADGVSVSPTLLLFS
jgi:hypothetical protein